MPSLLSPDLPVASILREAVAASRGGGVVVTAPLAPEKQCSCRLQSSTTCLLIRNSYFYNPVASLPAPLHDESLNFAGVRVGEEVGYHVRFDAQVTRDTRLIVATTGILLRRMLGDISLDGIGAVVLDEFHERTIEMDLLLGLLVRIRQTLAPIYVSSS